MHAHSHVVRGAEMLSRIATTAGVLGAKGSCTLMLPLSLMQQVL